MLEWLKHKKTIAQAELLTDFTDFHSHILPAVDDGIKSTEEAIKVLDTYQTLNIRKVVFTPHIMEMYPQNNAAFLRLRFNHFKEAYHGNVEISLGAEYMLDNKFSEHFNTGDLLPITDNFLLIETAYVSSPINFIERLNAIKEKGYFIILAHPERYLYMQKEDYEELKDMGVLFQMNLLSIAGGYGTETQQRTKELLHFGYYDFMGTDIHNLNYHMNKIMHYKLDNRVVEQMLELKDKSPFNQ